MFLLLLPTALASTLVLAPHATWEGDPGDAGFPGVSLAAGDVNGDGFEDSVLTSPGYDDDRGRILLYTGRPEGLEGSTPQSIAGPGATDELGAAVAALGDLDGDGFDDIAVGLPGAGEVWILRGSADGLEDSPWLTLTGPAGTSRFGRALDQAGDVDGDGTLDLVVSARDEAGVTGMVFLCLGSEDLDPDRAVALKDTGASYEYGSSVAGAGDVDGDGYDDVVVGDKTYSRGAWSCCSTVVVAGSRRPRPGASTTTTTTPPGSWARPCSAARTTTGMATTTCSSPRRATPTTEGGPMWSRARPAARTARG